MTAAKDQTPIQKIAGCLPRHSIPVEEAIAKLGQMLGLDLIKVPWRRHDVTAVLSSLTYLGFVRYEPSGRRLRRVDPPGSEFVNETPLETAIRLGRPRLGTSGRRALTMSDLPHPRVPPFGASLVDVLVKEAAAAAGKKQ